MKFQHVFLIRMHFLVTKFCIKEHFIAFISSVSREVCLYLWQESEEDGNHPGHQGWIMHSWMTLLIFLWLACGIVQLRNTLPILGCACTLVICLCPLQFCQWYLQPYAGNLFLLFLMLVTEKVVFECDDIISIHTQHLWSQTRPHRIIGSWYQQKFSWNMWWEWYEIHQ
jgi:hypothetical protein